MWKCCDLNDYPGDTQEDHIGNSIPPFGDQKCESEQSPKEYSNNKFVWAYVYCESKCIIGLWKGWCQNKSHHKQKGTILEVNNREGYCILEEGRWKNDSAKLKYGLKNIRRNLKDLSLS